jgi:TolB-like protein
MAAKSASRGRGGRASTSSAGIFLFEGFRLDRRGLFPWDAATAGAAVEIGSRALDVLRVLVARPGDLQLRHELIADAWSGMVVEDNNLTIQIGALRRVLDRNRANGSCIETVPGRGYRLVAAVTRIEPSAPPLRPPSPLSIVVLPFANIGNDAEQRYFTDGITEDVTTDLSRIVGMFVISSSTAFTYGSRAVDTRQIGRELGVRYVLQGSVQRSGKRVRVTARLIDAASDTHVWAERFDRELGDLFAVQNEITSRIAYELGVELVAAEAARPIENPDAMDFILRGRVAVHNPPSPGNFAEMISRFEQALALDPRSVQAACFLTTALMGRVLNGMSGSAAADIERAQGLVNQALALSPRNPHAHLAKAFLLRAQNRVEEAIPEYEMAIASNRNWLLAIATLGWCKFLTGEIEDAIPYHEQAIRLSPRDNLIGVWVSADRHGASLKIAHRRGDPMARKGAQRQSLASAAAPLARRRLRAQRRQQARRHRASRSPQTGWRRPLSEHRPLAGGRRIFRGAKNPRPVRGHLLCRAAQGRHAGGMTDPRVQRSPVAAYGRRMPWRTRSMVTSLPSTS